MTDVRRRDVLLALLALLLSGNFVAALAQIPHLPPP